jgi:hypothetical protein
VCVCVCVEGLFSFHSISVCLFTHLPTQVRFGCCDRLTAASVRALAMCCPRLTSVSFLECGGIKDDAVLALAESGCTLDDVDFGLCDR